MKKAGTWFSIALLTAVAGWWYGCGSDKKTQDTKPSATFEGTLEEKTTKASNCGDTLDTCQTGCLDKNPIESTGPEKCREILDGCLKTVPPKPDCKKQVDACVAKVHGDQVASQAKKKTLAVCLKTCGEGLTDCTEGLRTEQRDFVDGCVGDQKKCLDACPTVEDACQDESPEAVEDYVMQSIDRIYAQVLDCIKTIGANIGLESIKKCVDKAYDVIFDVATPPCAAPISDCHKACQQKTRQCLHP